MFGTGQLFGVNPQGQKVPLRVDANGYLLLAKGA